MRASLGRFGPLVGVVGAIVLASTIFMPGQSLGQTGSSCVTATATTSAGSLTVSDATPEQGQTITVSGSGFAANVSVPIRLDSTLLTTATSSSAGALSASVVIPASTTLGAHTLTATGTRLGGTCTLTASITVQAPDTSTVPSTGVLTVSDSTPEQGQTITASGTGFAANASVPITIRSHLSLLTTTTANASGVISASVLIPASTELGQHTLTARGNRQGGGTRTLEATITVVAPGAGTGAGTGARRTDSKLPRTGPALAIALGTIASAMIVGGRVMRGWSRQHGASSSSHH